LVEDDVICPFSITSPGRTERSGDGVEFSAPIRFVCLPNRSRRCGMSAHAWRFLESWNLLYQAAIWYVLSTSLFNHLASFIIGFRSPDLLHAGC
jgi:hypothetical protein